MDKLSEPVLILNSSYVPVSIRPVREAVCMMLSDKAEALKSSDEDFIRSEKLKIPVPRILLLSNYYSVPRKLLKLSRSAILERDGYTCVYCGKKPSPGKLTLDHVIPKSRWMSIPQDKKPVEFNSWENLVTACRECNTRKGSKLLAELKWKLPENQKIKPKQQYLPQISSNFAKKYGWSEYLGSET
ncbi:MAG TPA: HNH endonuclease [Leptospiraceae bacterium]|nr:HNH endonuclease [Leptospiraceae bacterium]HMY68545.1 HNH endonuclease [Leptospiraceae bacterium]HMZ61702.1 HNH endonuclease [Leptospiraceae bacterium]HNF13061.1 HNH endonuclease [Leptospiraceae bacterium]HNF25525.1 HNH endonuclease [Leptospiraceae bacterium]